MKRRSLILAALIALTAAAVYYQLVPSAQNNHKSVIATILITLSLYFLFEVSTTYPKMWRKILVFVIGIVWAIVVMLLTALISEKI